MTIHFDSSVLKVRADGARVLSGYLEPGETLDDGRTYEDIAGNVGPAVEEPVEPHPEDALTLTPDGEGSARQGDLDNPVPPVEPSDKPANVAGAEADDASTTVTPGTDKFVAVPENVAAVERPADNANKDAWFAYATSKGFEGEKDDLTKREYVEQYG